LRTAGLNHSHQRSVISIHRFLIAIISCQAQIAINLHRMYRNSTKSKFPRSISFIVANEAAERFSFYGMKAILTTFLVTQFFNPLNDPSLQPSAEAAANEKTHLFYALTYFLPILGGIAADWFYGKYRIILWLSIVYCCGNFLMAASVHNLNFFLLGLMMIAMGREASSHVFRRTWATSSIQPTKHSSQKRSVFFISASTSALSFPLCFCLSSCSVSDRSPHLGFREF
jgi:dipeptide/tripeptide permease